MTSQTKRVRFIVFGAGVAISLLVVFALWSRQGLVDGRPDPYWFSAMAKSVVKGDGFTPFGTLLHRRSPLYPLFIAGIYLVGGNREVLVQFAQCVLFGGTVALAYDIGRRVYNERTGRIAAAACLVHPALLRYVSDFHLETLLTFLCTLAIFLSVRLVERPTLARGAWFGFAMALATLTKAVMLLYPAIFGLVWLWRARAARSAEHESRAWPSTQLRPLLIVFAVMALTISPWTIRNYRVTGHFVPVSTGLSDAFLRGFVFSKTEYITLQKPPYTDGENEVNAWFRALCVAEGTIWEKDDYESDRILNRAARAKLIAEPYAFVRKSVVGLFTFWYEMTSLTNSLVAGGTALAAWLLASVGLRRARREGQRAWLLLAPILYLNVFLAVLLALGRYSVPIIPCLMVLAAFGVDTLLQNRYPRLWTGERAR